jgi:hypothetical protein
MKKIALFGILACSALFAASEPTRDWIAELRAGAFLLNSHTIKKMFGRGWIEGEAEFTYRFAGHFAVWEMQDTLTRMATATFITMPISGSSCERRTKISLPSGSYEALFRIWAELYIFASEKLLAAHKSAGLQKQVWLCR